MPDTQGFTTIEDQQVELLPARTMMTTLSDTADAGLDGIDDEDHGAIDTTDAGRDDNEGGDNELIDPTAAMLDGIDEEDNGAIDTTGAAPNGNDDEAARAEADFVPLAIARSENPG